jgi:hypothetical protein
LKPFLFSCTSAPGIFANPASHAPQHPLPLHTDVIDFMRFTGVNLWTRTHAGWGQKSGILAPPMRAPCSVLFSLMNPSPQMGKNPGIFGLPESLDKISGLGSYFTPYSEWTIEILFINRYKSLGILQINFWYTNSIWIILKMT